MITLSLPIRVTNENHAGAIFLCFAVSVTGIFAEIDRLTLLPVLILLIFLIYRTPSSKNQLPHESARLFRNGGFYPGLGIAVVFSVPYFALLFIDWSSEFRYGGDHLSHIGQGLRFAAFWGSPISTTIVPEQISYRSFFDSILSLELDLLSRRFVTFGILFALFAFSYRFFKRSSLSLLAFAILILAILDSSNIFRWPTFVYFLIALSFGWDNLSNAARINNVLALVCWTLVLRPLIVGRWPSLALVIFLSVFFWNPTTIWLFNSTYLEPWAIVFVLIGMETAIVRGRSGLSLALFSGGLGALCKEPAILSLPIIFILGSSFGDPAIRSLDRKKKYGLLAQELVLFIAAIVPFFCYLLIRSRIGSMVAGNVPGASLRGWHPDWSVLGSAAQIDTFFIEVGYAFKEFTIAHITLYAIIFLYLLMVQKEFRVLGSCLLGALSYLLFFSLDATNPTLAGYPRFFIWVFLFLAIPLLTVDIRFARITMSKKIIAPILVVLVTLQLSTLLPTLSAAMQNDWLRTSEFARFDPIYLPYKALLARVDRSVLENKKVITNTPDPFVPLNRYGTTETALNYRPRGQFSCRCDDPTTVLLWTAILPPRNRLALDNSSLLGVPRVGRWKADREKGPNCHQQMLASCSAVHTLEEGSILIGLMGIPSRE